MHRANSCSKITRFWRLYPYYSHSHFPASHWREPKFGSARLLTEVVISTAAYLPHHHHLYHLYPSAPLRN